MRHRRAGRKLGRDTSHRRAMMRNMVASLFKNEQLETTDAKAKQLRPVAEKMITLAKRGDLHARRQALSYINDKTITHRLFEQLKEREFAEYYLLGTLLSIFFALITAILIQGIITLISATLIPIQLAIAGIKRCNSP